MLHFKSLFPPDHNQIRRSTIFSILRTTKTNTELESNYQKCEPMKGRRKLLMQSKFCELILLWIIIDSIRYGPIQLFAWKHT